MGSFIERTEFERKTFDSGLHPIGIDEVGRGCLAGAVVVAAYSLKKEVLLDWLERQESRPDWLDQVQDSKAINESDRDRLSEKLMALDGAEWALGFGSPAEIGRINILASTERSMERAARLICQRGFEKKSVRFLIDGNRVPIELKGQADAIVKGDQRSFLIAAASIIAKVHRDQMMKTLDEVRPEYGFAKHKGYGTKTHLLALEKYGVLSVHRRGFSPVDLLLARDL
jgi:ribonuclease HII